MSYQPIAVRLRPKRFERTRFVLFLALFIATLTGCATPAVPIESRMRASVAKDFAVSLATLSNTDSTSLSMRAPTQKAGFAAVFQKALREQGFAVADEQSASALPVTYNIESVSYDEGASERYIVNIGPLIIRREYQRDNEDIYPVSAFEIENRPEPAATQSTSQTQPPADPFAELVEDSAVNETAKVIALPEPVVVEPGLPQNIDSVERRNVYKTGVSAFGEFTQGFETIEKQVLAFPNDSLRIMPDVVSSLETLANEFREESDVFSVIGCSHGNTGLANGNALLAVGRSKRVKQFLIGQGIPDNRILDEGCWAPVHFDEEMPRRGVVIELKRS